MVYSMVRKINLTQKFFYTILQIILSFLSAGIFTQYMKLDNNFLVIFGGVFIFYLLQLYAGKNKESLQRSKWWYLIFAFGLSLMLVVCKHMVVQFYDFYSDITANYITGYTWYDCLAMVVLTYTFFVLSFCIVEGLSSTKARNFICGKISETKQKTNGNAGTNNINTGVANKSIRKAGIGKENIKWAVLLTVILFLCWLPYLILYYPAIIYGDSTLSIGQAIGKWSYGNMHPFVFTLFVKLCISIGNFLGGGNTLGCAIYSVLQMLFMAGIFSYSICWLKNKNISVRVCCLVFLFFALPRFWGIHAVSMWKDPIFALALYFYSLKLFDLIYTRGEISKDKKYIIQCIVTVLIMCFFRHNGKYVAAFSLILMLICTRIGKNKCVLKKGLVLGTVAAILFSGIIQGPVFRHFGIKGTAAGAYAIPLQQVARVVVYEGNMSDEEKTFLNEIMPLEKYRENYSPGLTDHMKWSEDFNTEFFGEHHGEFMKIWFSLLLKNPKLYIEAWALETCGFWGLSYWELNSYTGNSNMGVPKAPKELKKRFDIISGSLLGAKSEMTEKGKEYFSLDAPIPGIALCLWISLFMLLYAVVKGKWRYLLFFIPCLGNIGTLLIATPITYWPRYGLSSLCLLPVSLLFPYLCIVKNTEKETVSK